jgi:hypothetical protein
VKHEVAQYEIWNNLFLIPPNADSHKVTSCFTLPKDVTVVAYTAHMHFRGKSMKTEAIYPDGRHEVILNVPNYNFRWQDSMLGANGYLSSWQTAFSSPEYNFIDTELGGGDNYHYPMLPANQQLFRLNLGSTLLGDGYMGLNNGNYGCWYWQPEYDLKLGFPRGPASAITLAGLTVWHRDFTHGVVWVNPTGYPLPAGLNNPAVGAWDASIAEVADTIDVPPVQPPTPSLTFERARPNPVSLSASTTLSFTIDAGANAALDVLDLRGRIVRHVWSGTGTGDAQIATWDGHTDQGFIAPAGVYFARLEGPGGLASQQKLIRTP